MGWDGLCQCADGGSNQETAISTGTPPSLEMAAAKGEWDCLNHIVDKETNLKHLAKFYHQKILGFEEIEALNL
ncbi:hypothetical protein L1049_023040 [Liquidambar formosana]|uniref:Uncharacterized protein n=1 Tax=Liquidambar formosana TaxID=63359 RepID=A0AAP0WR56_LIQFO